MDVCPCLKRVCVFPSKTQNYHEGLRYIGRLPFEQAESNMKRYGKTLMHHVPEGTTLLLKGLCTNYQPSRDSAEKDSLDRGRINKVSLHRVCCHFDVVLEELSGPEDENYLEMSVRV